MTLKFKLGRDFCTTDLPIKFHHTIFNSSEVIMLTNKDTDKEILSKTSTSLCYAASIEKNFSVGMPDPATQSQNKKNRLKRLHVVQLEKSGKIQTS